MLWRSNSKAKRDSWKAVEFALREETEYYFFDQVHAIPSSPLFMHI
jgi:hypothetical protein